MIVTTEQLEKALRSWNFQSVSFTDWNRENITKEIRTNGYLYSILQTIARGTQAVNFMVGKTLEGGAFEEDRKNELFKILSNPNLELSRKELIEQAAMDFMAYGELFFFYEKYEAGNNKGQIIPQTIRLLPVEITDIKTEGMKVVGYVVNGNTLQTISPENVIRIKNYNPKWDDFHGLSPIAVAGSIIDKLKSANETETKTYQNSGPAYLVSAKDPNSFAPEEYLSFIGRLKKAWRNATNKRGVIGTSGAVDVNALGMSPSDMGAIESQKNTVRALLVVWGLDAGLFDTDASTYNNKMLMNKQTYTEAIIPFLTKFYDKIQARFGEAYGGVEIQLDTSDVEALQPNYREKIEWMVLAGEFTGNEIRAAVNYDKRDSEVSDLTPAERMEMSLAGFDNDILKREVIES
jgi:HK97 family phage portal protein